MLHGGVVHFRGPGVEHVSGTDLVDELRRVISMRRVLHRVEVIEVPEELVESVNRRQKLVSIPEVVLAELTDDVTHRLEDRGDRGGFGGESQVSACLTHGGEAGPDRKLTRDEVCSTGRTARLGVIVGEEHPLRGQAIEVGSAPRHDAAVVCADVEPADVVCHHEDDVRFAR
jgi:hypothetical protein